MKQTEKQDWLILLVVLGMGTISGAGLMYLFLNPPAPDADFTQIRLTGVNYCSDGLAGFGIDLNNRTQRDFLLRQILSCRYWTCEANYTSVYCCRQGEVCAGG